MPEEPRKVPVGSEAPDFALEGAAGSVHLAYYREQAALLLVFMRAFG
jgi:peroxiredoxin